MVFMQLNNDVEIFTVFENTWRCHAMVIEYNAPRKISETLLEEILLFCQKILQQ